MTEHTAAPTCLVTGATGALGPALVRALVSDGWSVRALARTPPPAGLLPAGVDVIAADVTDSGAVGEAMAGVQVVMHLAAKLHIANPSPALRAEYERVNVQGTRTVVEAARAAGVLRLVFFSTISVYGPSRGRTLAEATPPAPETIYATTKHAAEQVVLGASAGPDGPPATILRLAAVYGPRVRGNYRRLLRALARRRFVPVGAGRNRRTLVHEEDAARAALLAARHPDAIGEVFNVTDGGSPTLDEIVRVMCAALGRRPPAVALPAGPVRAAAWLAERAAGLAGRRLPLRAAVDKYLEEVVVDGRRLRDRLGYRPALTLEAGWRQTVEAMRRDGDL
jgi:UDP-glucose 4-epimerase